MRNFFGLTGFLFLLSSLTLPAVENELYQPEYGFLESPAEGFFFPFPLRLSGSRLTLRYECPLSCRLVLRGKGEETVRELPPLDGMTDISSRVILTSDTDFPVSSAFLEDWNGNPVPFSVGLTRSSEITERAPLADHLTILSGDREMSGDYLLYRWEESDKILIFDFRDYETQDRYLKRLAFFMEKPGFRGTLMSNSQMEGLHGWNAHDYSKEGLASFFNLAEEQDFSLNREERELRQILLNRGILKFDGRKYLTGEGAIISISRETSPVLRQRFITHESLHGLFFTDSLFRESIRALWYSLPESHREIWRFFMENNAYDPRDEVLMYNEMLGYTLQLHRKEVEGYFIWRFNRIGEIHPDKAAYIERITPYLPEVMKQIYDQLEYLANRRYSYRNGSFHEREN